MEQLYLYSYKIEMPDEYLRKEYMNEYVEPEKTFEDILSAEIIRLGSQIASNLEIVFREFLRRKMLHYDIDTSTRITAVKQVNVSPEKEDYIFDYGTADAEHICTLIGPMMPEFSFTRPPKIKALKCVIERGKWYTPPPVFEWPTEFV